jgi:serine/threonine protein kinase
VELISPGRVLGNRYRLVEPLARGGMATVWIADDPVLSRRVAVKILRVDLAADEATRARFRNEAIAAARLNHPNIVSTYDTGDDDGTAYIVMELIDGTTLRHLIDETGGLPVADVIRIGSEVAEALEAAHRADLVHRDVKPANVLVPSSGTVKVTDFGIAKAAGAAELTRTGTVMGTARYLAPEQVNGRTADARTDVYALGLLLYEMCCGHPPFGGDTDIATAMARLTTSPPSIRAERPDVSQPLDDLVHRCLARDPAKRFASAGAVKHALDIVGGVVQRAKPAGAARATPSAPPPSSVAAVAATRAPAARPTTPAASRPAPAAATRARSGSGSWWWLVAVCIVAAAAGVGAYFVVRSEADSSSGNGGTNSTSTAPPASQASVTVTDFDPFDEDATVKQENRDEVGRAHDGDVETAWSTEGYENFSALKPGIGLRFDLDPSSTVSSVKVTATQSGWSGAIYVSAPDGSSLTTLDAWGDVVATASDVSAVHTFTVDPALEGRSVLVWFTALPSAPAGERQSLQVSEVELA